MCECIPQHEKRVESEMHYVFTHSRFGKFISMCFDSHGHLTGATIDTYLLVSVPVLIQCGRSVIWGGALCVKSVDIHFLCYVR